MTRRTVAAAAMGALLAAIAGTGCSSAPVDCVAPAASVPATVAAGESIPLHVTNLYPACQRESKRFDASIQVGEVTVTLEDLTGAVVSSVTGTIDEDGIATLDLPTPATASGSYNLETQGTLLGTITVEESVG